jgi:hypothetical protein
MRWYYMVYIMPRFIAWLITSCLDPLHDRLHPAWIHYMYYYILSWTMTCAITCAITFSRIHYMLHYIHYMLPNPFHAASVHRCQSIGSGPGHPQRRSDRCVALLARLARAVNSPSSVGFNLQDNIPACSDWTCSIQMKWLPARGPCTIEVEQCRLWLGQAVLGISRCHC